MEASRQEPNNPLGLSLDFMFGRGYLWARRQRLNDWIALESLRMEIPDLQFPFDARMGLERFRHTRCLVREVEFGISEVGLGDLLTEAASHLEGFEDLQVRFLEDAIHLSLKLSAFGAETYLSFRAALIPPEPARADEVHLSLYDYRAFGPLPYPARLVAQELLTSLLNTPVLRASGRGQSFTVGIAGDLVSFRPLKQLFLHIFPRVGWKLPNLSGVVLESARIRPGVLTIRGVDADPVGQSRAIRSGHHLATTTEGARAMAAYEAKELFAHADQALFEGQPGQALSLLANYRDVYGLHPELVERLVDLLLADPSPSNVAEAESIRRELVAEDRRDFRAALMAPLLALARRRDEEAAKGWEELAEQLKERRQTRDWVLCELTLAKHLADEDPEGAAARLREVLKVDRRNRAVLETLRSLYERLGEKTRLEEMLKRLTGVYTDRETLKRTYLHLARHLMDREGDLGEARMYLEKVLRLAPTELEALHTLGESYVLGGEPLRALKAFGSAARAAEAEGLNAQAGELHQRVGEIWYGELEDASQALLSFRRAISLAGQAEGGPRVGAQVERYGQAAQMCEELERDEEAGEYWNEVVLGAEQALGSGVMEGIDEEARGRLEELLARAHQRLGRLYDRRQRWPLAASHYRRALALDREDEGALEWLENYLKQAGQPEELLELYREMEESAGDDGGRVSWIERQADVYDLMGMIDEAEGALRRALEVDWTREDLRGRLVTLLWENERYGALRDALNSVLVRTRDREERFDIYMELGRVQEALGEMERAARSYLEAVKLKPADEGGMEEATRLLEALVAQKGVRAGAPLGSLPLGRLLENLLLRRAEMATNVGAEKELLKRAAMVADERGDQAAAAEARERAERLESEDLFGEELFTDVDARLDAMLHELSGDPTDVRESGDPEEEKETGEVEVPVTGEEPETVHVFSFRDRFQEMLQKPALLPKAEEVDPSTPLGRILGKKGERREEPKTVMIPMPDVESLRQRTEPEFEAPSGESAEEEERSGFDGEGQTSPLVQPVEMALKALSEVRAKGEPEEVVEAIEKVLSLSAGGEVLDKREAVRLRREVGELYYYDLEDGGAARPHLEAVRRLDPDGEGAQTAVVNALEAIYEEEGDVSSRAALLEERLKGAQSEEMATTYRLLLAQLHWDQGGDVEAARRWLDEVLKSDPDHEAAHRLLADMAKEQENWSVAALHLEVVVRVSRGGIDAVESQRELAELYLHRLDAPGRARGHFEEVLEAAPGDSMALEGIKETQAAEGDWAGYLESLGRELGLLTGTPEGLTLEAMREMDGKGIAPALRVPASQILADAAHLAEEELKDLELARDLWGVTYVLFPEQVGALERRVELNRVCGAEEDLARDLESLASMLLDRGARFEALVEAGRLREEVMGDLEGARGLLAEAVALVQDMEDGPEGLDEVRRRLKRLQSGDR